MNTRIRELAMQATKFIDPIDPQDHYEIFDKEKFAELIIRECAGIVRNSRLPDAYSEPCLQDIADDIEEHFGVE